MIKNDGYSIEEYSNINRIIICLPQTSESITNSAAPVSKRRTELNVHELVAILETIKTFYESNKED